ncbi:hypothetical protein BDV97DRAFT_417942 [Delphinella strobiligena]|nr:hypothetical protein BDV97DRAFT_417942 [Delphinella strobiligena]
MDLSEARNRTRPQSTERLDTESHSTEPVCEVIEYEDGATAFFMLIATGGEEDIRKITDLKLVIDSSNWSDFEDDIWGVALQAYAPLSEKLEHLQIEIKGKVLFTRLNYSKPIMYRSVPYGYPEGDSDSDSDSGTPSPPAKSSSLKPKTTASDTKPRPKKAKNMTELDSPSRSSVKAYKQRVIPPDTITMHVADKAFIPSLLNLHKPIPRITIQGPMSIDLRRHLIEKLNPDWKNSPQLTLQAGYGPADSDDVKRTLKFETECLDKAANAIKVAVTGEDEAKEDKDKSAGKGCWQRCVYGWRADAVHGWKGPKEP